MGTAMLVTTATNGREHARPMHIAEIREDGDIFFATSMDSPKITEIAVNPEVIVTFQGSRKFATVYGRAEIVKDRNLIDHLWSEAWKVWFPEGKSDPTLCLIRVEGREGEYWDNAGVQGIKYAFEAAKAYMQGRTPEPDEKQHGKLRPVVAALRGPFASPRFQQDSLMTLRGIPVDAARIP